MDIENIELTQLSLLDYQELKIAMIDSYSNMPNPYWEEHEIKILLDKFPEGQAVIKVNNQIAGCALSLIVDYKKFGDKHTYKQITGGYTFSSIDLNGDVLYGIDIFVKPEFRGLRLGRRLYDYRKDLCVKLNLKEIVFGGRIPMYHKYAKELTPTEYIEKVKRKEIHDPVLNFQISNDYYPSKILKKYLEQDHESMQYAVLLKWNNLNYEKDEPIGSSTKTVVRLGLIQWQMRSYKSLEELMQQAEYFVDAVSGYRCDFALFPEFFNAPLMAENNHLDEAQAIRELAKHTEGIVQKFGELAISYNINIITGSMP
jgi:GNAT superfamily N-acetyltransferase